MPSQVTVTGTTGPGLAVTALVITDVVSFTVDCAKELLTVYAGGKYREIAIVTATTITCTVSGNNYTLTIS